MPGGRPVNIAARKVRREAIQARLARGEKVSYQWAHETFGASPNTISADFKSLGYKPEPQKHPPDCPHCIRMRGQNNWRWNGGREKVNERFRLKHGKDKYKLRKFGLTKAQFDELLTKQDGKCGICGGPPSTRWGSFAIDHDHETGRVRGLLCTKCNWTLGWYEKRAAEIKEYLK